MSMSARELGLLAAAFGVVLGLVLVPIFRRIARWAGVVDRPDERPGGRKTQRSAMPLLGGAAVAVAATLAVFLALVFPHGSRTITLDQHGHILLAALLTFLIGLVDDVFKDKVGPLPKFIGQFVAVAFLFGKHWEHVFTGEATPGEIFHVITISIWFLTVVNAVNFVDNMNGLCSGLATISLLVGLVGVTGRPDVRWAVIAGGLGGAMLGFLPYNYPRARIYLGDAGSHLTGFFLALLSLEFTRGFLSNGSLFLGFDAFIPAMLLLGLPLFDLLFSVVRRYREKRPLFHGDARHLSHRLVGAGLDPTSAVMLLWGVHLILAAAGVVALAMDAQGRYTAFVVILLFLGLLASILVRVERRRGRARSFQPVGEEVAGNGVEPDTLSPPSTNGDVAGHRVPGSPDSARRRSSD